MAEFIQNKTVDFFRKKNDRRIYNQSIRDYVVHAK